MRLITKYLLREYLITATYCLLGFSMIYILGDLFGHFSKFISAQVSILQIILYYAFFLTTIAEYIIPASLLFATLYTLWQMTRHNELVAMRAGGIGMHRIIIPFLAVGVVFTIITASLKEIVVPKADIWLSEFRSDSDPYSADKKFITLSYMNNADYRHWTIDRFDSSNPNNLYGVQVTQERSDSSTVNKISAEKAEWIDGYWWFHNAQTVKYGKSHNPIGEPEPLGPKKKMIRMTEKPSDFANEVRPWQMLSALEMKRYLNIHKNLPSNTIARKQFDFHNRLAMPWACFIVTLFAIPAGAKTGRQSAMTGIFLSMAFFFAFYALNRIGMFISIKQLVWPWTGAWLSNMVFFTAGLIMLTRLE